MFAQLQGFLFPMVSAEFVSRHSLPETIVRLRDASSPFVPLTMRQTMICRFDGIKVELSRMIPLAGNTLAPVFAGSFREDARGVVLSGCFRTRNWVALYESIGFAFFVFVAALCILSMFIHPLTAWRPLLFSAVLLAVFYGQVRLCQWFARNDAVWLSHSIGRAIGDPADWPEPPPEPPGWLRWKFAATACQ